MSSSRDASGAIGNENLKSVGAKLQHDGSQHHRAACWRFHVSIGKPGMYRPHGYLDRKGRQKCEENELLHIERQWKLMPCQNIEAARLKI